jgi:hypothetical protein
MLEKSLLGLVRLRRLRTQQQLVHFLSFKKESKGRMATSGFLLTVQVA